MHGMHVRTGAAQSEALCTCVLLVGYNKFSVYQCIVTPGSFSLMTAQDGHLVDAQSAGCCSCDSIESSEGRYKQLSS